MSVSQKSKCTNIDCKTNLFFIWGWSSTEQVMLVGPRRAVCNIENGTAYQVKIKFTSVTKFQIDYNTFHKTWTLSQLGKHWHWTWDLEATKSIHTHFSGKCKFSLTFPNIVMNRWSQEVSSCLIVSFSKLHNIWHFGKIATKNVIFPKP